MATTTTSNMTEFRCVIWQNAAGAEVKREFQYRTQVATMGVAVSGLAAVSGLTGFTPWTPFPIVLTTGSTDTSPA